MSISGELRERVRQRAGCACEFCGVSEVDVGGLLTLDHFQPQSKGGPDTLENLLYACASCNQFKVDVIRLLERYQQIVSLQSQVNQQLATLSLEQQVLLREQRELLEILLGQAGRQQE